MTRTLAVMLVAALSGCGVEEPPTRARSALEEGGYLPTKDELAKALEQLSTDPDMAKEVSTPEGKEALAGAIARLNDTQAPCTGQCTCLAEYLICKLVGGNSLRCALQYSTCVKKDLIGQLPR